MRSIVASVCVALCGASLAAAQSTTTTIGGTSSTVPASSSTSIAVTTSTSVTSTTIDFDGYEPKTCARTEASKEDCREVCCTEDFDALAASCDLSACDGDPALLEQWVTVGQFYKYCQNPEDPIVTDLFEVETIADKFEEFNASDSCRAYEFGCKRAARKHARQCADSDRCVACCRTVLHRWRAKRARVARQTSTDVPACRAALRCLRRATRKSEACRRACRQRPTCGENAFRTCMEKSQGGRMVLACYSKCTDKCSNSDSYKWCLQACQGLDECASYDSCSGAAPATTTTTTVGPTTTALGSTSTVPASTSTSLPGGPTTTTPTTTTPPTTVLPVNEPAFGFTSSIGLARPRGVDGCLTKEPSFCVEITTTSSSTSTSTSSTSQSTTSTSSSTSTSSPLLVGGRYRFK
jgi:hypothetical protein